MHTHTLDLMPTVDASELVALQSAFHGELLTPDASGYDQARRVWNGQIDRLPALIARVRDAADVALALGFARRHDLSVAVRGGGHNTAGLAVVEGGLMIDLTLMKGLSIDPAARTARAEAGLTIGELVPALAEHGLVTPTGTCAGTGISGSTLGGGIGWLSPRYGMGIDNVLAFELVTADGRVRRAAPDEHPDLFWALRGGGGNFGVVTAIEYRLHPLTQILGGMLVYPLAEAPALLRHYNALLASAPDALGSLAVLTTFPEVGPVLMLQLCYASDDPAAGEALVAPLRSAGTVLLDTIQLMAYSDFLMAYTPPAPNGWGYYDTATPLPELSEAAIAALVAGATRFTSPHASVVVHALRGAAARVDPAATAFALRTPHVMAVNAVGWEAGPAAAHIAWAEAAGAALQPYAADGLYVNFMGVGTADDVRRAYAGNYARLCALKAEYDPANIFRLNQNLRPAERRGL